MSENLVIVPSKGDGYVELARTKTGRLFRKHILSKGDLIHPVTGKKIKIDDKFVDTLKTNFTNGVCDIVQFPLADKNNAHTEDPDRNIGEVIGVEEKDDKVYVVLDVRDDTRADKLGKTILGASAMLNLDYTDTKTGKRVGPTLLHTCATNRPYVTGLDDYEEIVEETVAATSDRSGEAVVVLTEDDGSVDPSPQRTEPPADSTKPTTEPNEEPDMPEDKPTETEQKPSLADLFATLKTDHGIDVEALQAKATEGAESAKLSQALTEALSKSGLVSLTSQGSDNVSSEDVVGAVADLAESNVTLTNRLTALERERAEDAVQADITKGYIKPAKKAQMVELKLTNPSLYDAIRPDEPIVKFSNEAGKTPPDDKAHARDIDADVKKYLDLANSLNGRAK